MRPVIVLSLAALLAPGCYQTHERAGSAVDAGPRLDTAPSTDTGSACLPDGRYTVPARLVSTTPAGCVMPMLMPAMLTVPPSRADFAMMCTMPSGMGVTPIGACSYAVDVSCPMIDASVSLRGTLDTHAPAITGQMTISLDSLGGTCTAVIALGS